MLLVFYKDCSDSLIFTSKTKLINLCNTNSQFTIDNIIKDDRIYTYKQANKFFDTIYKVKYYRYIKKTNLNIHLAELGGDKETINTIYNQSCINQENENSFYFKLYFDGKVDWELLKIFNLLIDKEILTQPNCEKYSKNKGYLIKVDNAKIVKKVLSLIETDFRLKNLNILLYDFTLDILNNEYVKLDNEDSSSFNIISSQVVKDTITFNKTLMNFPPVLGKKPYENYQEEDINKGLSQNRYAFFLGMGTGKSYIMSAILSNLFSNNKISKGIIITTNVGVYNLKEQILKLCNYFREDEIEIIKSNNKSLFLENLKYNNTKLFIFAYSTALSLYKLYKTSKDYKGFNAPFNTDINKICLCLDECHKIGSEQSQVSKAILDLSNLCYYRYLFTGTPGDKPDKFYNLFKILDFSGLLENNTFANFTKKYVNYKISPYVKNFNANSFNSKQIMSFSWKDTFLELKNKSQKLIVYRNTQDVLNLPNMLEKRISFNMDDNLKNLYFDYVEETISNPNSLFYNNKINQMQKFAILSNILDDPLLIYNAIDDETNEYRYSQKLRESCLYYSQNLYLSSPKIQFINDLLGDLDENQKVIIWITHPITAQTLKEHYKDYSPLVVTGQTQDKERQEIYKKFNDINSINRILIASSYVVNSSIDLFAGGCNIQVYLQREWSAISEEQTQARIYRLGQTKPVYTYFLLYQNSLDISRDYILKHKLEINHSLETKISVKDFFNKINTLGLEDETKTEI